MNSLMTYCLEVIVASSLLGSFYFIFFKNLTFFRFNRYYLLASLILPLVMPLIQLPVTVSPTVPNIHILLNEVTIGVINEEVTGPSFALWQWAYIIVAVLLLVKMISGVWSIISILRQSDKVVIDRHQLYVNARNINPFSVFKRIVVSRTIFQEQESLQRIVIHEEAHIQQHHGIDVFLAEILCTVFWFNPMVWILKKELKSCHEYLADEKVLEQDFDLADYFMLIFNNTLGQNVELANNFNQSLNLKRMKMMKKKRSSCFAKMMSVMAMPIILGATIMLTSQCTSTSEEATEKSETKSSSITTDNKTFTVVEQMPQFPGGEEGLMNYLSSNVKYPAIAQENSIQGRVYVEFVVKKDGQIADVKILKGVDRSLDEEALRVVMNMPDWNPGKQRGKEVNVSYRLPINFSLK